MAYLLVGQKAHEHIGAAFIVLVLTHNILNRSAYATISRAGRSPLRVLNSAVIALASISLIGLTVSGMFMSNSVFRFLNLTGGAASARTVHLLCAYWGFIFFSIHLGFHLRRPGRPGPPHSRLGAKFCRLATVVAVLFAAYGLKVFIEKGIVSYLFLRVMFVYFDLDEPLWHFIVQHFAMMSLFACAASHLKRTLRPKKA
jgi:hypothetical protein